MMEVISNHPFYPNEPMRQRKLEAAIELGFIKRELLEDGTAKYILTDNGALKWELELMLKDFMS